MNYGLNAHEELVWRREFPNCDCGKPETRENLVFVYPPREFRNQADAVADTLQSAMDYLGDITDSNPTRWFRDSRVVIGYTQAKSKARWKSNNIDEHWVWIPWKDQYLTKKDEPLDVCSHELVHDFYRICRLHKSNECWGECFCEFLRGPVKNIMGLDGKKWWRDKIRDKRSGKQNWGNVAGQFVLSAKEKYGAAHETDEDFADRFIEDREAIRKFVTSLFADFANRPLSEEFTPTSKMWKNDSDKGKI